MSGGTFFIRDRHPDIDADIAAEEADLDRLRYAQPKNEAHAAKLADRREAILRNLDRLRRIA